MSPTQMRLGLVVRRNRLPDANIVWPISLETDPTIASLVEQVNDVVPLESADWGLEDYAVELLTADGSKFECLHFQPIRSVLKEDDKVLIRPLATEDIKQRRFSGRHQISADGKHLVDGVAFGRPLLRTPRGRPPLDIPPRKRRRIGYEDEDDDDDLLDEEDEDWAPRFLTNGEEGNRNPKSVRFAAHFDGLETDDDGNDDEESAHSDSGRGLERDNLGGGEPSDDGPEQDDSDDDDDLDEDLEDELEDLRKDNAGVQRSQGGQDKPMEEAPTSAQEPDLQPLRNVEILQAAFPSAPAAVCEQILLAGNHDLKYSYATLLAAFKPEMPESKLTRSWKSADLGNGSADVASGHTGNDDDLDDEEEEAEDDEDDEVPDFVKQFDHRGLPPGSISSGTRKSIKFDDQTESASATLTGSKKKSDKPAPIDDDDTSSSGTSSASSSDEGEDDVEDSSSEDDSSTDDDVVKKPLRGRDASDSSDGDSHSDDSSDSGPEETTSKGGAKVAPSRKRHQKTKNVSDSSSSGTSSSDAESDADDETSSSEESSDEDSDDSSSGSSSESEEEITSKQSRKTQPPPALNSNSRPSANVREASQKSQPLVPPGAGKESTKKRNERRRLLEKMKKSGQETHKPNASPDTSQPTEKELFEAKRKALLDAIASGGVEVGPKGDFNFADESTTSQRSTKRKRNEQNASQPAMEVGVQPANGGPDEETVAPKSTEIPASQESGSPDSAQKRRRIDLGAGRRMLFGALGLRNPKTKDDEDKLRTKLMKDVRPLANARLAEATAEMTAAEQGEVEEEDPDAWREKITYRAVECCQEDIELSEPPFPFVQRWDPQQQGHWYHKKNKRGGGNKKAQRNQSHFYEEDSRGGKKRKHGQQEDWENEGYDNSYYDESQAMELNYDDVEEEVTGDDPTAEASQFTDVDDLPSLPKNLGELVPLTPDQVKTGMVITWKQFILSKATNWQPQVNDLTGVVVRIDDEGTSIQVLLARRDRNLDRTEKQYDENTGQRIYERFEAPVDEDADEEALEEQGYRTLAFAEMMEPKILQEPLTQNEASEEPQVPSIEEHVEPEQASEEPNVAQQENSSEVSKAPSIDGIKKSETIEAEEAIKDSQANQTMSFDETFEGFEDGAANEQSTPVQPPTDEAPIPDEHIPNSQIPAPALRAAEVSDGQPGPGLTSAEVSMSDISQISSPSRQLCHGTTHQSIDSTLTRPAGPEPPVGDSQLVDDDPRPSIAPPELSAEPESSTTPQPAVSVVATASDASSDGMSIHEEVSIEADCAPTQEESSAPSHFNETSNIMTGTPRATYPTAVAPPSSAGSLLSGRQPDIPLGLDLAEPESFRGTTEDEAGYEGWSLGEEASMPMEEDDTPTKPTSITNSRIKRSPQAKPESAKDNDSPSSLSSLNTVWCTAASSRNTLSPARGRGKSVALHRTQQSQAFKDGDEEYREAMRRLDNLAGENESDANLIPSKQSRTDTQLSLSVNDGAKSSPEAENLSTLRFQPQAALDISPPRLSRKRRLPKPSHPSQTSIPAGSQIIEISSESDEPRFTEDYADEDVDATYSPATESSLHSDGSGWVQKTKKKQWSTRSSTAPLAPGSQDETKGTKPAAPSTSSQMAGGRKSMESAVSVFKRWNKGRKTSARF